MPDLITKTEAIEIADKLESDVRAAMQKAVADIERELPAAVAKAVARHVQHKAEQIISEEMTALRQRITNLSTIRIHCLTAKRIRPATGFQHR